MFKFSRRKPTHSVSLESFPCAPQELSESKRTPDSSCSNQFPLPAFRSRKPNQRTCQTDFTLHIRGGKHCRNTAQLLAVLGEHCPRRPQQSIPWGSRAGKRRIWPPPMHVFLNLLPNSLQDYYIGVNHLRASLSPTRCRQGHPMLHLKLNFLAR